MTSLSLDLFTPPACRVCGREHEAQFLPNYEPPVWVIGVPPKCGENLYGPSREWVAAEYAHKMAGFASLADAARQERGI
jgi:hypothetical protein